MKIKWILILNYPLLHFLTLHLVKKKKKENVNDGVQKKGRSSTIPEAGSKNKKTENVDQNKENSEKFNQFLMNTFGVTDDQKCQSFFQNLGRDIAKREFKLQNDYEDNSNKTFPTFKNAVTSAARLAKKDQTFNIPEVDVATLKSFYTNYQNEGLNKIFNSILQEFIKDSETRTLGNTQDSSRKRLRQPIKYDLPSDSYVQKLTKEEKTTKQSITLQKNDNQLALREKLRNRLVNRGDAHKFKLTIEKYYKKNPQ